MTAAAAAVRVRRRHCFPLGVAQVTVNVWCLRVLFPNARREDTARGPVWSTPASDLAGFVKPKPGAHNTEVERHGLRKCAEEWRQGVRRSEVTEEEVRRLIREELLEIFEEANERSRQWSPGFGTSPTEMTAGLGMPTEYLVQVIRERVGRAASRAAKSEQAAEKKDRQKGIGRWENEGGATTPAKKGGKR